MSGIDEAAVLELERELRDRVIANIQRLITKDPRSTYRIARDVWPDTEPRNAMRQLHRVMRLENWPRPKTIIALSDVLCVDPSEFFKEVEDVANKPRA